MTDKDIFGMSAAVESFKQACANAAPVLQEAVRSVAAGSKCPACGQFRARGMEHRCYGMERGGERTPTVSLPTAPIQDTPVLEETQVDYWTQCPTCNLALAYCRGH
jgi:hypothetical protein